MGAIAVGPKRGSQGRRQELDRRQVRRPCPVLRDQVAGEAAIVHPGPNRRIRGRDIRAAAPFGWSLAHDHPRHRRLARGSIAGEIGDPDRFETPKKLIAYAGMDASKYQSGANQDTNGHMSKRGSSELRRALMLAADKVRIYDPYFGEYYDSMKARGKHHYVALSGVARKLAGVCLSLMREQPALRVRTSRASPARSSSAPSLNLGKNRGTYKPPSPGRFIS